MKSVRHKILALAVVFAMLLPLTVGAISVDDYTDMPDEEYWSYSGLAAAIENGIFQGDGDSIMPEKHITLAEAAAYFVRAMNAQAEADISGVAGIEAGGWYTDEIAKAVRMGVIDANGGYIYPNMEITREIAFDMLWRVIKTPAATAFALDAFPDAHMVSSWYIDSVASLTAYGYIDGKQQPDGVKTLSPKDAITRAEFAALFNRIFAYYINEADIYGDPYYGGNLVINTADVTVKNAVLENDLIIGDGAGDGRVTLSGVTLGKRIVARGANAVNIVRGSAVEQVCIIRADGDVRVYIDQESAVRLITVDGGDSVFIEGGADKLIIDRDVPVTVTGAVGEIFAEAAARLVIAESAEIGILTLSAPDTTVEIAQGATVGTVIIESAATGAAITGGGAIKNAIIDAENVVIEQEPEKVTVNAVYGATVAGQPVGSVTPNGEGESENGEGGGENGESGEYV